MGTVIGTWRLRLMLVLIIFIISIYFVNSLFYNLEGNVNEEGFIDYSINEEIIIGYNESDIGTEENQDFVAILFGIGDYLTFGNIDNFYIRTFFNIVVTFVFLAFGYIIYTYIKEWVPFV